MKIVKYFIDNEPAVFGWIDGKKIGPLSGPPYGPFRRLESNLTSDDVKFIHPFEPTKIIAVGRNYSEHAREQGKEIPSTPMIFLKPPSSIIGNFDEIILPPQSNRVEFEGELAVVIGRKGRWISINEAKQYILGYSIANDVTARDLQHRDGQWSRAKGFDTFCPIGPWIETDIDVSDLIIRSRVNGEVRQMASTREMVFNLDQLIVYISSIMTIEPGDVLLTGTPAGVGKLEKGDVVTIEIDGIGVLENRVGE